ncbi:DUF928 domain-containing protein [Baaleninema sp.]|uniref:DUF928 domain-containing protein n=1 Tax=Baaleninema sp. TaxID=3101197 RepID=UPI003D01B0E6
MTRSNTFTLLNTPTLWFYVPYLAPLQAELSLLDENNLEIDTIQFELPSQPGIIGVKLPSIPEVNRRYRWVFSLICNPDVPALNITIGGVIQQVRFTSEDVAPDWIEFSETHRSYDAIRTQIFNLEEMGIWYDILTAVGTRYFRTPANATIAEDWNALLESANLDAYRDIPIVAIYSEN